MSSILVLVSLRQACLTASPWPFITTRAPRGAITAGGSRTMRRTLLVGLSVFAMLTLNAALANAASDRTGVIHAMKANKPAHHKGGGGGVLLASHGGAIEQSPSVYITYWGPQWASGFTTGGHTSAQAQSYVQGFFGNVGGSSWANSSAQYCQGVAAGTTNCAGMASAVFVTNPSMQLAGVWNDTSPVPSRLGTSSIAGEALRAVTHFGYHVNADYMVFTPSGLSTSGFGTQFCAWHSFTSSSSGPVSFANIPYQPDAGAACGQNFVNGNGYFDGSRLSVDMNMPRPSPIRSRAQVGLM